MTPAVNAQLLFAAIWFIGGIICVFRGKPKPAVRSAIFFLAHIIMAMVFYFIPTKP